MNGVNRVSIYDIYDTKIHGPVVRGCDIGALGMEFECCMV